MAQIDSAIDSFTQVLTQAIQTAGKPNRGEGKAALWWTPDCQAAYIEHIYFKSRDPAIIAPETRQFLSAVKYAKRDYWKHIINGVSDKEVNSEQLQYSAEDWKVLYSGEKMAEEMLAS